MDKMGGLEMGRPFLLQRSLLPLSLLPRSLWPRSLLPRFLWPRSRHPELVSG